MEKTRVNKKFFFLILLSIAYSVIFFLLKYFQYKSFFSFEWDDDAVNVQLAYNTLHGLFFKQSIFNAPLFYGRFTPIIIFPAIFFKFFPYVPVWFALISFSYGFSAVIVYLISNNILKDDVASFLIVLIYLFYAPLHYLNLGTVEPRTFALLPIFLMYYFFICNRYIISFLFFLIAISAKQDIALVGCLWGGYCLYRNKRIKSGIFIIIISLLYFFFSNYLMNNVFYTPGVDSHPENLIFVRYNMYTVKAFLYKLLNDPYSIVDLVFSGNHLRWFVLVFYPLCFIPLFSLETYIAIPIMLEIFITKGVRNYDSEYLAVVIPFLFIGFIWFFRRLKVGRNLKIFILILVLICSIFSNFYRNIIGDNYFETPIDKENCVDKRFNNVRNIFNKKLYIMDSEDKKAWKFISLIPRNASVTASGDLLLPLAMRNKLYSFGLNESEAWENEAYLMKNFYYPSYEADYILIHTKNLCNGLGGQYAFVDKAQANEIVNKLKNKYVIVKKDGNFILLHKKAR